MSDDKDNSEKTDVGSAAVDHLIERPTPSALMGNALSAPCAPIRHLVERSAPSVHLVPAVEPQKTPTSPPAEPKPQVSAPTQHLVPNDPKPAEKK